MSLTSVPLPVVGGPTSAADALPTAALEALLGSDQPRAHALGDVKGADEAAPVLRVLLTALQQVGAGAVPVVIPLEGLSDEATAALFDALAEGEVTASVRGAHVYRLRETALHGVWHVKDETARREYLEVADVPQVVRGADLEATKELLSIGKPPEGVMNVLPLLAELRHRMQTWKPGEANHVVSFTLLPMNEVDMRHLEAQLGHGPVMAESRGYGRTRVELTGHRHIWSVQYLNVMGAVVLDTLEVGDVPGALLAGREDFEDSAERLAELLGP